MSTPTPAAKPPFLWRLWDVTRRGFLLHVILERLPARYAAIADRYRRGQRDPFGGPLNGQPMRRRLVESILGAVAFDRVVETGTYRGSTAEYLARLTRVPILTVELVDRYFLYATWRLRRFGHVAVVHGESVGFLRSLTASPMRDGTTFFYLDAHWEEHLPLREEIELIATWPRWIALIDDFEVPDDPGYGFDDYGPDRRLALDYLDLERWPGIAVYWPSTPSAQEGGSRRGCIVLASPSMAPMLDSLPLLRAAARPGNG